ncbi:hypothetical protein Clacol_007409 [Clathrus columnatus]|uniref:Thioredoxin domain-containing protein n=1 Tax=Clathrus columnatus TaxID=1419009 RepID=A0AAV5AI15_9AGAM|nr:hypothetical protein Clacol_007409 [Clathrus columnatus]
MSAMIRRPAPDFTSIAVVNGAFQTVSLEMYKGRWYYISVAQRFLIISIPLICLDFSLGDFTFVCPTEIVAFNDALSEFEALGAVVLGVSTDSEYSHLAWSLQPRKQGGLGPDLKLPLLADKSMKVSRDYGVLIEEEGIALRGLFIIDPAGILRQMSVNDLPVGRSVDETLRLLKGLQFTDKHGEVCPANWTEGGKTIKADPRTSLEYFESVANKANGTSETNGKKRSGDAMQVDGTKKVKTSMRRRDRIEIANLIGEIDSRSQKPNKSSTLSSSSGPQAAAVGSSTSSIHLNAPSTTSLSRSYLGSQSLRRNKDRFSKAFTFSLESFNVVGSIRGRSKPIPNLINNISSQSIPQSHTTYAGYEDDEYGEPEVEAEEIRPPSGLGRTASILEFNSNVIEKSNRTSTSVLPKKSRISESSDDDSDSLVEIRYPTGLGNIRLTITPVSVIKPKEPARSTYPDFYLQYSRTNSSLRSCKNSMKETIYPSFPHSLPPPIPVLLPRDYSSNLCKILPILNSYLETTTLSTLTLVNRSVGLEARKLLWRHVRVPLRLVLSKSGKKALLDGERAAAFLDFLARKDVSHFINSLELICRMESEASCIESPPNQNNTSPSHPHPRSRPPPLSLLLNNHNLFPLNSSVTVSPPAPSLTTDQFYTTSIPSTPSRFRRASIVIRNATIPSAFRNSSLGRRLSMLKAPMRGNPSEDSCRKTMPIIGQSSFPGTQSQSSHLTSLSISSSSTWQPPPEWERLDCGSASPSPSIAPLSAQRSGSPSSFRTHTPNSGWNPPVSWGNSSPNAKQISFNPPPTSTSSRIARHAPSLSNLKPKKRNPRLSLSLLPNTQSTPSLASRPSPLAITPTSPDFNYRNPPAPPTPVTPHSAISLSAFPLPPPITPSRSLVSAQSSNPSSVVTVSTPNNDRTLTQSYSAVPHPPIITPANSRVLPKSEDLPDQYLLESDDLINNVSSVSPKSIESGAGEVIIISGQPGFIDGLKMDLRELTNLKTVTIRYDIISSTSLSSIEPSNLRFTLIRAANQLLVTSLKDLHGLKSIVIACPTDYSQLCSTQLTELGKVFTDVEISVVTYGILQN